MNDYEFTTQHGTYELDMKDIWLHTNSELGLIRLATFDTYDNARIGFDILRTKRTGSQIGF